MESRSTRWPSIELEIVKIFTKGKAAIQGKLDAEAYGDWSITVLLQMIVVNLILKAVQKPMRSECF